MTVQTPDTGSAEAAVQALESAPTQSHGGRPHDRAGGHAFANLLMLASLGLIPPLAPTATLKLTYSGQDESTYSVRALREPQDLEQVTAALARIHDALLSDAKQLDQGARQILNEHLWNLYIT